MLLLLTSDPEPSVYYLHPSPFVFRADDKFNTIDDISIKVKDMH